MKKSRYNFKNKYLKLAVAVLLTVITTLSSYSVPVFAEDGTTKDGKTTESSTSETTGSESNDPDEDNEDKGEQKETEPVPQLTVDLIEDKSSGTPMFTAGTKAIIRLPFLSKSNQWGIMVDINATLSSPNHDPLQFIPTTYYQRQNYIGLNTPAYFEYEIDVPITAKPGLHTLTLTITYDAVYGYNIYDGIRLNNQSAQLTYYYTIINDSYDAVVNGNPLRVTGSISPDSVEAGDVFEVGIKLQNDVPVAIPGVAVTIEPPAGFLLLNDANIKTVSMSAGGSATVTFRVTASDKIQGGQQQFTLNLSYANPGGKQFNVQYHMVVSAVGSEEEEADKNPATVDIKGITLPESASAGDEFTAVVTITNTSDKNAVIDELAVTNTLGILNRTNALFSGITLTAGETRSFEIKYYVPEDTKTAYANFSVSLKYHTEGGTVQRNAQITGGMNILALAAPSLSISLDADKSVKAGGKINVTAIVKNHGGDASNITVTIKPSSGIVPVSQNKIIIDKLASGAEYKCTFQLLASDSAPDGYNLIEVEVVTGELYFEQYTGTNVSNPQKNDEEPKVDMPVIIIDSYDYGGESVYAGKAFTLTLTIKNTSRTTPIKDMKMVIQSKEGTFTPTSSSNTFFVESLGAGESVTKQIELVAKSDSKPLSYPIEIIISYKNSVGESGTSTEEISIPVQQEIRFNKGALNEIGTITMPDSGYLLVSAGNLGMSTIRNVRFTISGEGFSPTETEYFAGTIEPGQQASHEFELIPYQGGYLTGVVTYTYEDTQGETYTETQEFGFEVIDNTSVMNPGDWGDGGIYIPEEPGMEFPGMEMPGMEEDQGFFAKYKWFIIGGAAGIVVVAVVVTVVIVKRRKKIAEEEDED